MSAMQHHTATPRQRLPTLQEVLTRKTAPPVDLFCYYTFLQRENAHDALDFWLDVLEHEQLLRAYFKDLNDQGRSCKDEWPDYYEMAKKRGSVWNSVNGVTFDAADVDVNNLSGSTTGVGNESADSQQSLSAQQARGLLRTPSPTSMAFRPNHTGNFSPTMRALFPHERSPSPVPHQATEDGVLISADMQKNNTASTGRTAASKPRLSLGPLSTNVRNRPAVAATVINRDKPITREVLYESAERIYNRYLMPGAEHEIFLPNVLRIHDFPTASGQRPRSFDDAGFKIEEDALARIPDMFHPQKEWVFRALEQDSFPRFLRSKAFGNLTPMSAMIRLIMGLLAMWIALSVSLSFIFLDVTPKTKRLWVSRKHSLLLP